MSEYRVCVTGKDQHGHVQEIKFDNKEDAEHYAKNHSVEDSRHRYQVQKNDHGEFEVIKTYFQGQETDSE